MKPTDSVRNESLNALQRTINMAKALVWNASKRQSCWQSGPVTVVAKHPILKQVASDILAGTDVGAFPDRPIILYSGIHVPLGKMTSLHGYRLGIQTEHFYSSDGRRLWKDENALRNTIFNLRFMDGVIDLNPSNSKIYKELAFTSPTIELGPHIFPSSPPQHQPGETDRFVFFGSLRSERRKAKLASLPDDLVKVVKGRVFGKELAKIVRQYRGVLNLHYDEGIYVEYPRLLSALLAGKPVASDPLTEEFIAGRHYLPLTALDSPPDDDRDIFYEMASLLCDRYSFASCLKRMGVHTN